MEILAAMMIGSMVLIAVLTIYTRAENIVQSVTNSLDDSRRAREALQLIAEDLDKMITTDSDIHVVVVGRHISKYEASILVIREKYKDPTNKDQTYKEIFWQCNIDPEGDPNDLILYRSYEGIVPEDKLLDRDREKKELNDYVPICNGVTYFDMLVFTTRDKPEVAWTGGMPLGIAITISFAKPFENEKGQYEVLENEKYTRIISFDKTRDIKFDISEDEETTGDESVKTEVKIVDEKRS